jgi:hypothetical protein
MKRICRSVMEVHVAVLLGLSIASMPCAAQAASPASAFGLLRDKLLQLLQLDGNRQVWLSASAAGINVDATDRGQLNDIANICLPPEPVISSYNSSQRLDQVYETILDGMVPSKQSRLPGYEQARSLVINPDGSPSAHYLAYSSYEKTYMGALNALAQAPNMQVENEWKDRLRLIEVNWAAFGFKEEIAAALSTINADALSNAGFAAIMKRRQLLEHYRQLSLTPTDASAAFRSPISEFLPMPPNWSNSGGWVKVSYSEPDLSREWVSSSRTTHADNDGVTKFTVELEIKRVAIRRPWFDSEVLVGPGLWTWRKSEGVSGFPYVAVDPGADGAPVSSSENSYGGRRIDCALLPIEFVIARERTFTGTVSRKQYAEIMQGFSSNGSFSTLRQFSEDGVLPKVTSENAENVTFKVANSGMRVVAFLSEILHKLPNPDRNGEWPHEAWLPP